MMQKLYLSLQLFLLIFIFYSCVERQSLDDFIIQPDQKQKINDTSYIQINPVWTGFKNPQDILIGREPFIYIADTDNDRIVMMNLDGKFIAQKNIKKPVAIAQDYRLNLIVCGAFDTVINGNNKTFSAIYKIDLFASQHNLNEAKVYRVLPSDSTQFYGSDKREFTGVTVFYDNSYLVSRVGPDNAAGKIDPDNAILKIINFKDPKTGLYRDSLLGREPNFLANGTGLMSINQLSSLTSFNRKNIDFINTQIGNTNFKVQWLVFKSTSDYTGYENKFDPSYDMVDLYKPNRFFKPEDVTIDNQGNILVIDSQKDSLFRFTSEGKEKFSFGGEKVFKSPKGLATFDRILYICDSGNDRILRFILSTDLN